MMNFFSIKNKAFLFPLLVGILLLGIVITLAFLSLNGSKNAVQSPFPSQAPTQATSEGNLPIVVKKVLPEENVTLTAGAIQVFTIYFQNPVELSQLSIVLTYLDVSQDNSPIDIKTSVDRLDPKTIRVKTVDPIKPRSEYSLIIKKADTGETISSTVYLSGDLPPIPAPSNNKALVQYLPYETITFSLEYLASKNIYVFHFKYNPNLPGTVDEQFANAKSQAIDFIKSKGIDPSSLTIDFRSS